MKQALLYSLMATTLLGATTRVSAQDMAQITLNAVVRPGACTITAVPSSVVVADIKYSALAESTTTAAPFAIKPNIRIDCERVHKGVHFSVTPAVMGGDGLNSSLFGLGGPLDAGGLAITGNGAGLEMGTYTLTPGIPTVEGVVAASKDLMMRADETVASAPAASELLQRDMQYTFERVLNNPSTKTTASTISFDMDGELVFPSLDTIRAAGTDMLQSEFHFATAITLTAIF